jgi:hypothetical protein
MAQRDRMYGFEMDIIVMYYSRNLDRIFMVVNLQLLTVHNVQYITTCRLEHSMSLFQGLFHVNEFRVTFFHKALFVS